MSNLTRRNVLGLGAGLFCATALSACGQSRVSRVSSLRPGGGPVKIDQRIVQMYAAIPDEPYPVPAVNLRRLDPAYYRTEVRDPTGERPGTLVVDTGARYLYLVGENGMALRYGIGIGRDGFAWSGRGVIGRKAEWPTWTPPKTMIAREPELAKWANGMPPGPNNPLGARALYIYRNGRDTLYRLHGNPDESSIGRAVSSGCVRLLQQDVIDLYRRVPVGAQVIVR